MARRKTILDERVDERGIPYREKRMNQELSDRLFAEKLTPTEKIKLTDRLIARALVEDSKILDLSPETVFAAVQYDGRAIQDARKLIKRYFHTTLRDKKGIVSVDEASPKVIAGVYNDRYREALQTLDILAPISRPRRQVYIEPDIPQGILPCRYKAFVSESKLIGVNLDLEADTSTKIRLLTKYFKKFVPDKLQTSKRKTQDISSYLPADIGSLYLSMLESAEKYAKKSTVENIIIES